MRGDRWAGGFQFHSVARWLLATERGLSSIRSGWIRRLRCELGQLAPRRQC